MKKLIAILMAATMMVSMGVCASAVKVVKHSTTSQAEKISGYGIKVSDKNIIISQDGKTLSTRPMKNTKVIITNSKDGGVAVQYSADNGKITKVAMGNDTNVTVSGTLESLTIKSGLNSNVMVNIAKSAQISELKVDFKGEVQIDGTVNKINITTKEAKVTASSKATVGKVSAVAKSSFVGKSDGTSTSPASSSASKTEKSDATDLPDNKDTKNPETSNLNKTITVTDIKESIDGITFQCDIAGADVIINGKNCGTTSKGKNVAFIPDKVVVSDITIQKEGYTPVTFGVTGYYTDENLKNGELKIFA